MARKERIDMTGLRFGRLVGLAHVHSHGGHAHWLFACDCGAESVVNGAAVRSGKTASCGCLHRELSAARLTTHGRRARKRHDPTYRAWQEMNDACANRASARYRGAGAIGVSVAPDWRSDFEAFAAAMGERPPGTHLARIDTSAAYGPGNCRWVVTPSRARRAEAGWRRRRADPAAPREQRPGA